MLPSRRLFLARSLSLLVGTNEPESVATFFGADFLVECRGLHCAAERQDDGSWRLTFSFFLKMRTWCSEISERTVPPPALQKKLAEVGIATEYDGPFLVARSEQPVDPNELLNKMLMVTEGLLNQ